MSWLFKTPEEKVSEYQRKVTEAQNALVTLNSQLQDKNVALSQALENRKNLEKERNAEYEKMLRQSENWSKIESLRRSIFLWSRVDVHPSYTSSISQIRETTEERQTELDDLIQKAVAFDNQFRSSDSRYESMINSEDKNILQLEKSIQGIKHQIWKLTTSISKYESKRMNA